VPHDASPGAPGLASWGTREASFYATVAPATPDGLVPRCFDASAGGEGHDWYLLLEDLSDSHRIATRWPLPPSEAECRAMVGVLARFQGAWWDDPRLGVSIGAWTSEAEAAKYLTYFEGCYRRLADRLGDALSAERRALYERYFATAPLAKGRFDGRRNLSIVHGDAHVWNVFLPNDGPTTGSSGHPLLFDWDAWRLGLVATDLAYMMALHWYPERRRRFERPLLDHYHATLIACGVTGYDRRALDEDYRLAVVMTMMVPLVQADNNLPAPIWWSHLERIMLAVDDLGGRALLGG